jgi:predicted nucleotidyltransferase
MEYESYIETWRARVNKRKEREKQLSKVAKERAKKCAEFLAEEFKVRRVYLFGSLAEGFFHEDSDIDLAVEGLEPHLYFKALAKLHEVSGGFKVDLVPLEVSPYKDIIVKEGELLYEAEGSSKIDSIKGDS